MNFRNESDVTRSICFAKKDISSIGLALQTQTTCGISRLVSAMARRRLQLQRFLSLSSLTQQYPVEYLTTVHIVPGPRSLLLVSESITDRTKPNDSSGCNWNPLLSGKIGTTPAISFPCHEAIYSGRWLRVSRRGWKALIIYQKHKILKDLVLILPFTAA